MPPSLARSTHAADPLPLDIRREQRPEPVPPQTNRFAADIYATLEQEVLDVPQRKREADLHHDHEPDNLAR